MVGILLDLGAYSIEGRLKLKSCPFGIWGAETGRMPLEAIEALACNLGRRKRGAR